MAGLAPAIFLKPIAFPTAVTPAKAGVQLRTPEPVESWIPAFAGMTPLQIAKPNKKDARDEPGHDGRSGME